MEALPQCLSANYSILQRRHKTLVEVKCKKAAIRKRMLGEKISEIVALGHHIETEKLSYKEFQKSLRALERCFKLRQNPLD